MPKHADVAPVEAMLKKIEKSSVEISDQATDLSQFIELIENRLLEMPGKTGARVDGDERFLEFARYGDWGVWLHDEETASDEPHQLSRVSVERKAKSFPLLIRLLAQILIEQERQLELLKAADVGLRSLFEQSHEKKGAK
jgi:hypothetical protein